MKPLLTPELYWEELEIHGLVEPFVQDATNPDIPATADWAQFYDITLSNLDSLVAKSINEYREIPHDALIDWDYVSNSREQLYNEIWDYFWRQYRLPGQPK